MGNLKAKALVGRGVDSTPLKSKEKTAKIPNLGPLMGEGSSGWEFPILKMGRGKSGMCCACVPDLGLLA